jgi:hypothetical protein
MSQDLLAQLAEYGTYCDELQGAATSDNAIGAPVPILAPVAPARPGRTWLVGLAAAALVLVVLGGVALLAPFGGQSPPVTEEPVPTTVEVTPTTEAAITTETVAETTTTIAAAPILPSGEGPKLSFVQAELPTQGQLRDGVWFKGATYALAWSTTDLYRTTDGFTWEHVPGLPDVPWDVRRSMLQTDGERLVSVLMPADGARGIRDDAFIQISTSTNGVDWTSSTIKMPVPIGSNLAGEFQLGENFWISDNFAVGPKGIVVTATINLSFEGESFARDLVDPDEGIHPEVVDLDLDKGVMIVRFVNEETGEQIGDLREIDLKAAGFSNSFSNLLDAMIADPDWAPLVDGFLAQLTIEDSVGYSTGSAGYAWFSPDGVTWERIESSGPLNGGEFAGIVAAENGFVATASSTYDPSGLPPDLRYLSEGFDNTVVWQSADGTTWTEAPGLTSGHGTQDTQLAEWQGELVELVGWVQSIDDDMRPRTLAGSQQVFSEIPTQGMWLNISDFGLIGTPSSGWWGPDATELLFSVDGTNWNRWEPSEFDIGGSHDSPGNHMGDVSVVGVGSDFVVLQHEVWDDETQNSIGTLWVGTIG